MRPTLLFLLVTAAWAQSPTPPIPATPAGKMLSLWMEAFNSGDRGRIETFTRQHVPQRLENIDEEMEFRSQTGGFTLVQVEGGDDASIRALVKDRNSGTTARLEMKLHPDNPSRVARIGLRPVASESDAAPPQRGSEQDALRSLDQEAGARAARGEFSGALLVARNGQVLMHKAYGLADREKGIANTTGSQFRIGSMNKMFTATAMLQLVARGKAGLDDPIAKHWKDYPNQDLAQKVTIRHLLSHTGGTGDIFGPEFDKHRAELKSLEDYAQLYGARGLKFEPGTRWAYSNYGYLLLGLLIEKISGVSYYDYVRDNIYKPTGMTATDSLPESAAVPTRTAGYRKVEGQWVSNANTLPWRGTSAGGGYSTVEDLFRFAQALQTGKLLPPDLARQAATIQFHNPEAPPGMGYGFGFMVQAGSIGHGGGAPGMNGELMIFPKQGRVVAVLSNLDPPSASRLARFYTARMPAE